MKKYFFILGGPDREMFAIIDILKKQGIPFIQPCENWEKREILPEDVSDDFANNKREHVYVECFPDKELARRSDILIDHHDELTNERASIIQVKNLLGLAITQEDLWVEGWDTGGVSGALKAGMPREKIEKRLSKAHGKQKMSSWLELFDIAKKVGETKVITIHGGILVGLGQVVDYHTYPEKIPLLIISSHKGQVEEYMYTGRPTLASKLKEVFGGFVGGNPKEYMFWGIYNSKWSVPMEEEVINFFKE
jgi:hypothetical protein